MQRQNSLTRRRLVVMLAGAGLSALPAPASWAAEGDFNSWLRGLRKEAIASGIRSQSVDRALKGVHEIPKIIELDRRQPETVLTFDQYIERTVTAPRIASGRQRLTENAAILAQISGRYGVEPRFIVALWGLETDFGRVIGDYPVISALATLAYDGRRSAFFRRELIAAIKIVDLGYVRPEEMIGSWAGAMGQSQFMPSSYLQYAVSYSGDGRRDIWHRREDVFASIANFLAHLGWRQNETWGSRALIPAGFDSSLAGMPNRRPLAEWQRLGVRRQDGAELPDGLQEAALLLPAGAEGQALLAYNNFRVIMRWNNSVYFAASVGYLADAIE